MTRSFGVLIWLEWKRLQTLAAILAVMVFLTVLIPIFFSPDRIELFGNLYGARSTAMAAGLVLTLGLTVFSWARERRTGLFQMLLGSPASAAQLVLARFAGPAALLAVFLVVLNVATDAALGHFFQAKAHLGLSALAMLYVSGITVFPICAWVLLGFIFVWAFRSSGTSLAAMLVFLGGSGTLGALIVELLNTISGRLAKLVIWPDFRLQPEQGWTCVVKVEQVYQEPLWVMLGVTLGCLVLSGVLWREVEV